LTRKALHRLLFDATTHEASKMYCLRRRKTLPATHYRTFDSYDCRHVEAVAWAARLELDAVGRSKRTGRLEEDKTSFRAAPNQVGQRRKELVI
jgi:hypothetical protein